MLVGGREEERPEREIDGRAVLEAEAEADRDLGRGRCGGPGWRRDAGGVDEEPRGAAVAEGHGRFERRRELDRIVAADFEPERRDAEVEVAAAEHLRLVVRHREVDAERVRHAGEEARPRLAFVERPGDSRSTFGGHGEGDAAAEQRFHLLGERIDEVFRRVGRQPVFQLAELREELQAVEVAAAEERNLGDQVGGEAVHEAVHESTEPVDPDVDVGHGLQDDRFDGRVVGRAHVGGRERERRRGRQRAAGRRVEKHRRGGGERPELAGGDPGDVERQVGGEHDVGVEAVGGVVGEARLSSGLVRERDRRLSLVGVVRAERDAGDAAHARGEYDALRVARGHRRGEADAERRGVEDRLHRGEVPADLGLDRAVHRHAQRAVALERQRERLPAVGEIERVEGKLLRRRRQREREVEDEGFGGADRLKRGGHVAEAQPREDELEQRPEILQASREGKAR